MGHLQETMVTEMVLGMLLLVLSSQTLRFLALKIPVFHYEHKMIQVHERDSKLDQNWGYAKLQQVAHYASNLEMDFSLLVQKNSKISRVSKTLQMHRAD